MTEESFKYKTFIINIDMWMCLYADTMDELNAKIDKTVHESKKPIYIEIYTHDDHRNNLLADWKLIETREIK